MTVWRETLKAVGHTPRVVDVLDEWNRSYGPIEVNKVSSSGFQVEFSSLPEDLDELAAEINALCPEIISQGYGSMHEVIEQYRGSGQPIPGKVAELVDGVDLNSDDFGSELLKRDLQRRKSVTLWWD